MIEEKSYFVNAKVSKTLYMWLKSQAHQQDRSMMAQLVTILKEARAAQELAQLQDEKQKGE